MKNFLLRKRLICNWRLGEHLNPLKLTLIIVLTGLINVSVFSQTINYSAENVSLETVFKAIKDQTGYVFFYNYDFIKDIGNINVDFKETSLEDALKKCLDGHSLSYLIENQTIAIIQNGGAVGENNTLTISGRVFTSDLKTLPGATILIKGTTKGTTTNENGEFKLSQLNKDDVIVVSYIGFQPKEFTIVDESFLEITLLAKTTELTEAVVYATGYQEISKERATGSYTKIDNKLFNYKAGGGIDVVSRLEDLTTGLLINRKTSNQALGNLANMTIRGANDFGYAGPTDGSPLIVIDDIPYNGNVENINPNDVENITILKDAAATSIYGARAANGVIVIITKKASYNKDFKLNFNTTISISDKPDLFSIPTLGSSDFIDLEKKLYDAGKYEYELLWSPTGKTSVVSPAVRLFAEGAELDDPRITALRNHDLRNDLMKYVYRKQINQQYNVNLSQGTEKLNFFTSIGYDKNLEAQQGNDNDRISLRTNIKFKPIKKLELSSSFVYTQKKSTSNGTIAQGPNIMWPRKSGYYPYARLADDLGNPLALPNKYRIGWAETEGAKRGLDWTYVPLNDVNEYEGKNKVWDLILKFNADYSILPSLKLALYYQYEKSTGNDSRYYTENSFLARDYINSYTENPGPNQIRHIPIGGILNTTNTSLISNSIRQQLNFDKTWNDKHNISAIAGSELIETITESSSPPRIFGYNPEYLSSGIVDFKNPVTYMGYSSSIDGGKHSFSKYTQRNVSIYANTAYAYDNRYIFSFSIRKDGSNLFGAKTNQKFNPFWSVGGSWNVSNESFYKAEWLPYLKFSMSYGKGGNIGSNQSAYLTTQLSSAGYSYYTGFPYARITRLPNPELRWMTVATLNMRFDFALKNNRLNGSLDYFSKKSKDIFSEVSLDPITGKTRQILNGGELSGKGIELVLNSQNLTVGDFKWNSNLLFTYNKSKVEKYDYTRPINSLPSTSALAVMEGYDSYLLFSYNFAGLDELGNPQGYVDGVLTSADSYSNSNKLTRPTSIDELVKHGSTVPIYYGALRNSLSWKGFEFSFNLSFKFGYYFRKETIEYNGIESNWGRVNPDYADRWKTPGDELTTNIPSEPDYNDWSIGVRDNFYKNSSATVAKGDHIRLQDVNLSYTFNNPGLSIQNLRVYVNASNLGIIWRANDWGLDPDLFYGSYTTPRIITFGLSASF